MSYDGPPIYYAIRGDNTPLALERIRAGADVDFSRPNDGNAVLWAAFNRNFEVLRELVARGARLNHVHEEWGKTALDVCEEARCYKLLLDHGAVSTTGEAVKAWATYDLDALLRLPTADALGRLLPLLRGVLLTEGERRLVLLDGFLHAVDTVVEEARAGSPQEAVKFSALNWQVLDEVVRALEFVEAREALDLVRDLLKPFGAGFVHFLEIPSDRIEDLEPPAAAEIVRLLERIRESRGRIEERMVGSLSAQRPLFEKP